MALWELWKATTPGAFDRSSLFLVGRPPSRLPGQIESKQESGFPCLLELGPDYGRVKMGIPPLDSGL